MNSNGVCDGVKMIHPWIKVMDDNCRLVTLRLIKVETKKLHQQSVKLACLRNYVVV